MAAVAATAVCSTNYLHSAPISVSHGACTTIRTILQWCEVLTTLQRCATRSSATVTICGGGVSSHGITPLHCASACLSAAFTASTSNPVRPRISNVVRAQAAGQESAGSSLPELSRRQLLSSSVALGAASSLLPLAAPGAAQANRVLSSDWEQVRGWHWVLGANRLPANPPTHPRGRGGATVESDLPESCDVWPTWKQVRFPAHVML